MKFKDQNTIGDRAITGSKASDQYATGVARAFLRAGGKQIFFGRVGHVFPAREADDWDSAIVTRYPSPRALADFWLDDTFIETHAHRTRRSREIEAADLRRLGHRHIRIV